MLRESGGDIGPGSETLIAAHRMTAFGEYADDDSASTLKQRDYKDATDLVVQVDGSEQAATLRGFGHGWQGQHNSTNAVVCFEPRYARNGRGAPDSIVPPLKAQSGQTGKGDAAPMVAFAQNTRDEVRLINGDGAIAGALAAQPGMKQQTYVTGTAVRRLTPVECERLQGFPDGWTAGFADSVRYRMLGNAVCVPVAEWIGHRIVACPW